MASHQSNSENIEAVQNPVEHQPSSAIQTGKRKFAILYMCLSGTHREPCTIPMMRVFAELVKT